MARRESFRELLVHAAHATRTVHLLAAVLFALAGAAPLRAQADVFGMGGTSASAARQRFEAEAREQVSALLLEYESAWGSHDAAALTRLYARNATLYPATSGMLTGRAAVADYLRRTLPGAGGIQTRILEFRASGDLAFTTVQVRGTSPQGGASSTLGTDVFVLRRNALGVWSIVSHLSRPEQGSVAAAPDPPPSTAPADSAH